MRSMTGHDHEPPRGDRAWRGPTREPASMRSPRNRVSDTGVGLETMMSTHHSSTVGARPVMPRRGHAGVVPWVLVDVTEDSGAVQVLAEGTRPRDYCRLGRTRICGNGAVETQITETVTACARHGEPQARTMWMPNGTRRRCVTAPVLGPDNTVHAVQVWAGPAALQPPPRPTIATLTWDPVTGVARTTGVLEKLIEGAYSSGGVRTMPDLMRHFARFDDRVGLLALFGDHPEATTWSGCAESTGAGSGARRQIRIVARRCGQGRESVIRAVAHDITASTPVTDPALPELLLRRMPVTAHHAIAVVDLRTNLLHEWIVPGQGSLARWVGERAHLHPEDRLVIADARHEMTTGNGHCRNHFRIRFDDSAWLHLDASWTGFAVGSSPQVMLDITAQDPAATVTHPAADASSSSQGESR